MKAVRTALERFMSAVRKAVRKALERLKIAVWVLAIMGTQALVAGGSVSAQSLGTMAQTGATDLQGAEALIEIVIYIVGVCLVIVGLIKLKRYNDSSRDQRLGGAVMTMVVGALLIALPALYGGFVDTFGVDETATIERPSLN